MAFLIYQLEKAKESADAANLRSLYAETAVTALQNDGQKTDSTKSVTLTQSGSWEYINDIAGINPKTTDGFPTSGTVYCHIAANGTVTFNDKAN